MVFSYLRTFLKIFAKLPKMFESLQQASDDLQHSSEIIATLRQSSEIFGRVKVIVRDVWVIFVDVQKGSGNPRKCSESS